MKSTSIQTIHSDAVSTLSYDASVPCSHIVWHGFASSQDFRAACLRAYELMRQHRLSKGISDARNLRIISLTDQQWFTDEYLPMVFGLQISSTYYSAVIVPKDYFGRQSLDAIAEMAQSVITQKYEGLQATTRYFDNEDDARQWLMSLPDSEQIQPTRSGATDADAIQAA